MKSTTSLSRRASRTPVSPALTWSHIGVPYRVTPWPDVRFERLYGDEWVDLSPTEDAMASAAQTFGPAEWRAYLEFVPTDVRELLEGFRIGKMDALQVAARCPELVAELTETPALVAFLAAHTSLRGTNDACWNEINAIHERSGIFGVLEWLGLPASRQTLTVLRQLAEPEVPKRLLARLRTALWEPQTIFVLQKIGPISDRELTRRCERMAA